MIVCNICMCVYTYVYVCVCIYIDEGEYSYGSLSVDRQVHACVVHFSCLCMMSQYGYSCQTNMRV